MNFFNGVKTIGKNRPFQDGGNWPISHNGSTSHELMKVANLPLLSKALNKTIVHPMLDCWW